MTGAAFLVAPALAFFVAAASPGPATLSVAATSMARGRPAGLAMAAGLSLGLAAWGVVAATGLGALMLAWAPALGIVRIAGGCFLLWLAWRSAQSALRPAAAGGTASGAKGARGMFRQGLLLNLLNPKALLAWGAVIALGMPAGAGAAEFAAIVGVCSALGCAIYAGYAVLFSLAAVRAGYARARRWIDGVCAALFAAAGGALIAGRT
ncbi:LysE family transporter [Limibaculum sp. M0105]|uniref:LysE family transporter n=1 Tax=Thermohalobaculum xanthum TaxID=2753746 RepID=A0A8J7M8B3_9RHOB|nr:LysE family transporter [Thermohalobaculum xanthum]MBK0400060.1 LysE family transporter [Thermohalobaculum xanthum]